MTEFHTVKRIDNSRVVRVAAPRRLRECARLVAMGMTLACVAFLYAWQHFQYIQLSYQVQQLKEARMQAVELNQQLTLESAVLKSPERIRAIAEHELGLRIQVPGQIAPAPAATDAVVAQAHRATLPSIQ